MSDSLMSDSPGGGKIAAAGAVFFFDRAIGFPSIRMLEKPSLPIYFPAYFAAMILLFRAIMFR